MYENTCCFTGHRNIALTDFKITGRLEENIELLIAKGVKYFISGGALGFDTLASNAVIKLKGKYPDIELILALPCQDQDKYWCKKDKEMYSAIKKKAVKVHYITSQYMMGCMHERNRFMVDHSKWCICYLNKNSGGTAYTVSYAAKKGLSIINIVKDG